MDSGDLATYQNSGYTTSADKKSMVLHLDSMSTGTTFNVTLTEPFIIDKPCDVYLDNFTTHNALANTLPDQMGFIVTIDQLTVQSGGNDKTFQRIVVPNEAATASTLTRVHKGRKMNYISYEYPQTLRNISGTITNLPGTGTMGASGDFKVLMELIFVYRK